MILVLTACAATTSHQPQAQALVPVASYHQHLLSPAAASIWSRPQLAAIELPEEFATLLRERERGFGDKAALARLYTDDALLLDPAGASWIRGQLAVADFVARTFIQNYRLTPVAFDNNQSTGHLAGYLTRGEGAAGRHIAHVFLSLKKSGDGAWLIAVETLLFEAPGILEPLTATDLIAQLDAAGTRRALVLSLAYIYGDPRRQLDDEYAQVRVENDWTAQEVARFPDRLVGFCAFSPLKDYAIEELARCATRLHLRGVKLHFGNSGVDLRSAEHLERIRAVFRAANERHLPIVVHLRTRDPTYGRQDAQAFLEQIVPAAPDIPIQIAHLSGAGPGYPAHADEAMAVFADAISAGDPHTKNLYFDVTTVVTTETSAETADLLAKRIRQVGPRRVLFGADLSIGDNPPPRQAWAVFRAMLPLSEGEFRTIAGNLIPHMR